MSTEQNGTGERRLTPADVHTVRFSRATMLRPGYNDEQVDHFLDRVGEELARLHSEKAELRDEVHTLRRQLADAPEAAAEAPSDQAVRILASAQQTADAYVAEAEDFSRQMTADARSQYEEQLRRARENAGAIIQAAQEAAAKMVGQGGQPAAPVEGRERTTQELEEQVAYLKAFAQACRTQLRAYLEALLTDVETEWGRAEPSALPAPVRTPSQRALSANVAREVPRDDGSDGDQSAGDSGVEVFGRR